MRMGGSESGSDLKLMGTKLSPFSYRIEWALQLKGIHYEFVEEDLKNKSSLLLQLNPVYKKVPVLIHEQKSLSESLIILEYIDETWKHNPILPKDPLERAHARFWAKFVDEKLYEAANKALFSVGEAEQAKANESMAEALQLVEGEMMRLTKGKTLFGGDGIIGYLDIVLGWVGYWFKFGEEAAGLNITTDSTKYPAFVSWTHHFLQLPLIKNNLPTPGELLRVSRLVMLRCGKITE
ncbi:Glutathione S-transferase [Actinidia chinensis var. chinensis]|uniref:Glutathione S-transferase n=1 Tax=Actinidia chinensis var. chinensis TaxID=1590841 RepID=A0A2R6QVI6_ACTCC|nr:Glutathione S-transferase [Actinidia chinensis var. chinensis]